LALRADPSGPTPRGDGPLRAVFIRAPWVAEHGDGVEVLAEIDGHPVAVRQDKMLAVAFHPELSGDSRLHRWLVEEAA
jgi:pyridoxal 5'-phosphate synthase pdxT subunit